MRPEETPHEAARLTRAPTAMNRRLRLYSWGVVGGIALSVLIGAQAASTADFPGEAAGGDYPAFYGAGAIADDGRWEQLYSFEAQAAAQSGLNETEGSAWFFAYPPPVAVPYAPLSRLPYGVSYLIHTAIMAGFLVGAVMLARPMIPWIRGRVTVALAAAVLFWPLFRGLTGGSNTALTMFLLVAAWRLARDHRDVLAGIVLGVLLYKPQYGMAPAGLFLLDRRPRLVAGFVAAAGAFYALSAYLLGPAWITDWLDVARVFERVDLEVNGSSASSFIAFAQNALGVGDTVAVSIGYALAAGVVVGLVWLWLLRPPMPLDDRMALTIPGLLLLSPHTMSHDVGIVLIAVAYLAGVSGRRGLPWLVALYVLGSAQVAMKLLGFSPGFFTLLLVAAWALRETLGRDARSRSVATAV